MKKVVLLFSLLLLCVCVSYAQIYKWTDSQGNVHFGDVPHEGAVQVKVNESQTYSAPKPLNNNVNQPGISQQTKPRTYDKVEITQPENESTIRNNQGSLVVAVQLEPDLTPGDMVQLLFDGAPLGEPQANLTFQLNGVYRGTHSVAVQVVDPSGGVLNTSDPVVFHMHRPRVGMGGGGK